ncbi:MAG: hypothetical protein WCR27_00275, partial [Eubacteriales bacterium]
MKEVMTEGNSLEKIKQDWALKWKCYPEEIIVEVLEKPSLLKKVWKVKLKLEVDISDEKTRVIKNANKYLVFLGRGIENVVPYPIAGVVKYKDQQMNEEFAVKSGEMFEYYPLVKHGELNWKLEIDEKGENASAKVKHQLP